MNQMDLDNGTPSVDNEKKLTEKMARGVTFAPFPATGFFCSDVCRPTAAFISIMAR